jgi:hypothetical protein
MIVCLLMIVVRDDCLLMVMVTIIFHHYHQQTNSHISPLPSTNNQSSLTITINKQKIISHHSVRDDWLFVNGNGER